MRLRILVTGGTFDKEYDEITGKLYFKDTHVREMLRLGRADLATPFDFFADVLGPQKGRMRLLERLGREGFVRARVDGNLVEIASNTRLKLDAKQSHNIDVVVDRVVVRKGERRLELLRGNEVLRSYKVALGLQPEGHKEREGDFRTPEGSYRLTRRNAHSDFFLAVQVSYPESTDIALARRNGWSHR